MLRHLAVFIFTLSALAKIPAYAGHAGAPVTPTYATAAEGDLVRVEIRRLKPTQFTVGLRYVALKSDMVSKLSKKERETYLEGHSIPAVRGYDGQLYMIDHHHLARAVLDAGFDHAYVKVIHDWSQLQLTKDEFWNRMKSEGFVYLRDENNQLRSVHSLYDKITDLVDDPYRALAGEVRDEGGYTKTTVPFTEFAWANYFRALIPLWEVEKHWKTSVQLATKLARSPDAQFLPGFRGRMCSDIFN